MRADPKKRKILFLCTGNSARSIFAEYLMKKMAGDRFEAFSAGSDPRRAVNPFALQVLKDQYQIDARNARSKSWDDFRDTKFDIIITVCDRAKESCPVFPGQPLVAHWSIPDPAQASGSDEQKLRQFRDVAQQIQRRIQLMCSFPIEKIGHLLTQSNQEVDNE